MANRISLRAAVLGLVAVAFALPALAASRVNIAVVTDGPAYQLKDVEKIFEDELLALTEGEFDVHLTKLAADWSVASVSTAMAKAYDDPNVDMVLVLGFAANQLAVSRTSFSKPTFLPLVFNPDLLDAPTAKQGSGRKNLNYLADRIPFSEDLASFQRVAPFSRAVILTDAVIIQSIPRAPTLVRKHGEGIKFSFIGHDGINDDLLALLPADAQAVLLGGLPRLAPDQFDGLLLALAERGLPTFSLVSEAEVRRGALAADAVQTDYRRLARRNALNMQAVMLGERAQDQSIYYDGKRQLTINMATARILGISPRFDVLSEAELLNARQAASGPQLTLTSVAQLAIDQNLDLAASAFDVRIGEQSIAGARANLLPQIGVGGSFTNRRENTLTRVPGSAERSTVGAVTLDQLVYSEAARSGYQQEKILQEGRVAALDAVRLDSVLDATSAYLQALRAENQLKIQQDNLALTKNNLELARDRVSVGSASNADVYRWEAGLATARSNVLSALAAQQQSYDAIGRLLNQPIGVTLNLKAPTKDAPFGISAQEFDELINNPRRFGWLVDFSVSIGLEQAPELVQLQAQIDAVKRDRLARRRAFWAPDVSVQAQYSDAIDASGLGSGSAFDKVNDWSVSLNASWPLYDAGARRAQLSRAALQERQLVTQKSATERRIEQSIRASFYAAQATSASIELSQQGATASRQNLALVSDAYRQGTVTIIDLLDAQNQSLQADLTASNAVYDFLLEIMSLQRTLSSFDFLLPRDAQNARTQLFFDYVKQQEAQRVAPGEEP